jgi:tRNA-splicing endonuclease subunit Sen54
LSTVQELSGSLTDPPYRTAFYVYKPSTPFRKSAPPEPDFRIAVVDARTHTTLPRLSQLRKLLDSAPDDPPVGEKMRYQLYARLKHGLRNVLLAVVDQGIVSYLRFSDAGFTQERLFEQMAPKGPKTGRHPGKGKGKGRGR